MPQRKAAKSFAALVDQNARVLILGTLPGQKSLELRQRYGNKNNSFWKIMGDLIGAGPTLPYRARLARLKKRGIAIWDVCKEAQRKGSLDSNIDHASIVANDFAAFFKKHKKIELICFNGQFAAQLFRRHVMPTLSEDGRAISHKILPSTSPAHARMDYARKLAQWRVAICDLIE